MLSAVDSRDLRHLKLRLTKSMQIVTVLIQFSLKFDALRQSYGQILGEILDVDGLSRQEKAFSEKHL